MAVSKLNSGSIDIAEENLDGLESLRRSLKYFKDGLIQFRVCHDLCLTSNLLDSEASYNLDQCAIDFRQLSICVASLAEKIASLWCKTCALFYKNFDKITGNPKKVLENIAQQAEELKKGFEHLKDRAGRLADKFSSIQCYTLPVHKQLVKTFEDKSDTAIQNENVMENAHNIFAAKKEQTKEDLRMLQEAVKSTEESMKSHWIMKKITMRSRDEEKTLAFLKQEKQKLEQEFKNAEELEQISSQNLETAKALVGKCKNQESKAKVYAEELGKLMLILRNVEAMCNEIAKYWLEEQNFYTELSSFDLSVIKERFTAEDIQKQVQNLPQQQELMEAYHKHMIIINSSCNFPTKCQPSPLPIEFFLPRMQITWK